ncbi:MAG: tetratricopeptide repeat protein [Nitrospinaceae bacterium]
MAVPDSTLKEHQQVREHCGYFWLDDWRLWTAAGRDTFSFLQTQTTNDCLKLKAGEGHTGAMTTRKANLQATFTLYKTAEDQAFLLMEEAQRATLIEGLEQFLFREDLRFEPPPAGLCLLALQGPESPALVDAASGEYHSEFKTCEIRQIRFGDHPVWVMEKNLTGDRGFVLALPGDAKDPVFSRLQETGRAFGLIHVGAKTREVLRIEAGLPVYGRDMDAKVLLPETGLEHTSVSYQKGCYIGQEVIARMKTYGAPSFALMGILTDGPQPPPFNAEMKIRNKRVGVVKSGVFSPAIGKAVALAYIQKDFRSPDQRLQVTINEQPWEVTTALLPFHQPRSNLERAEELHRQAMVLYKQEEDLDRPIALLRQAIALAPKFAMGYEALGVLLSRQNKLDEAIALMKRLVEIDPSEIMAHSNLSVYYMQQGRIEDAEMEKGEATALQFEKIVEASQQQKSLEKKAAEEAMERDRQIDMFRQVLEIDPIDQVANFGLGSIYFEQGRYADALGPLQTVVDNFKDYSAAYLVLGKNLEKLDRNEEAAAVYKKGIAAAAKKGDLMPLRDMQNRLQPLAHSKS